MGPEDGMASTSPKPSLCPRSAPYILSLCHGTEADLRVRQPHTGWPQGLCSPWTSFSPLMATQPGSTGGAGDDLLVSVTSA